MAQVQLDNPASQQTVTAQQAGGVAPPVHVVVKVKATWADEWRTLDYLTVLDITESEGSELGQARLVYHAGEILREDRDAYQQYDGPLALRDHYVRIERLPEPPPPTTPDDAQPATTLQTADQPADPTQPLPPPAAIVLFTGYITEYNFDQRGAGSANTISGDQILKAYSLEYLLDRVPMAWAWCTTNLAIGVPVIQIMHVPSFNVRHRRGINTITEGNRSTDTYSVPWLSDLVETPPKSYVFSDDGAQWSARQVIEYLLAWHAQGNTQSDPIPITLGGQLELLDYAVPAISVEGMSVKAVIDKLCARKRGIGWRLHVEDEIDEETQELLPGRAELQVFSLLDTPLAVDNLTVAANPNVAELDIDSRLDLALVQRGVDSSALYDTIMVVGERVRVAFTVSVASERLLPLWTSEEESRYLAAASTVDANLNDALRGTDGYNHVYTRFGVPGDWDWTSDAGYAEGSIQCNFEVKEDGNLSGTPVNARGWGLASLRELPIIEGTDPETGDPMFLQPLAIAKYRRPGETSDRLVQLDRLGLDDVPAMHLRVLERALGVELVVQPPHLMGKNSFTALATGPTRRAPVIDYNTLVVTLAAETDERLRVVSRQQQSSSADVQGGGRILRIEVPDAHLWYVAEDTVIGITEAGEYRAHAGGVVRNDRETLVQVAALARAWYGRPRQPIRIELQDLTPAYPVGSAIRLKSATWNGTSMTAVVTRRTMSLENNLTVIEAGGIDLDFVGLVRSTL
jgi:hypothetical protein